MAPGYLLSLSIVPGRCGTCARLIVVNWTTPPLSFWRYTEVERTPIGPTIWNSVPDDLKTLLSLSTFKRHPKTFSSCYSNTQRI